MENSRCPQGLVAHPDYTDLFARITEEDHGFTVQVRLTNHIRPQQTAWGEEIADSFETASVLITALAEKFSIPRAGIRIEIRMQTIADGTLH